MSCIAYTDLSNLIFKFNNLLNFDFLNSIYMLKFDLKTRGGGVRGERWVENNLNQVSGSAFAALFAHIRRDL